MAKQFGHTKPLFSGLDYPARVVSSPDLPPSGAVSSFFAAIPPITGTLLAYAYLQALDLLTTAAFLLAGVREANPLVVFAMALSPTPLLGLGFVKAAALLLGLFCWWTERNRLLRTATLFYAVLIAYNLVCLILGLSAN